MTNGGFDIIIGNPPYIEFKKLDSESKDIFKKRFQSANGKYDIYVVFMEYACELLNKEGTLAFINPTMFMKEYITVQLLALRKSSCLKQELRLLLICWG